MRNALLALAALAIVGAAWLVSRGGDAEVEVDSVAGPERARAVPAALTASTDEVGVEPGVASDVERLPLVAEPSAAPRSPTADPSVPTAVVLGRVVDERERPVPGAQVFLGPVGETWREGVELPLVRKGRWTVPGWELTTGADGVFRFETPLPTADRVTLRVEPSRHVGLALRHFGSAGGRDDPRLVAGENDLGDIVLAIGGSLTGSVRDASGVPIAEAEVRLEGKFPGGLSVRAVTDEDGRYELDHLPAGTWSIGAGAEGWLAHTEPGCEVVIERTLPGPDFRLARAPTIAGVVVDEDARPLADVPVWGWPASSGRGAGDRTDADGRFTIALPQDEPYRLEVTCAIEYEPWGERRDPACTFDPGSDDVRIVLRRATRTTFAVVDAGSGATLERFAIQVARQDDAKRGSAISSGPIRSFERYPGGEVVLRAQPGRDVVGVAAPGHAPLAVAVAHDPGHDPGDTGAAGRQTLRLSAGGSLAGRIVAAREPVAQAEVRLDGDPQPLDPSKPFDPDHWFAENTTYDLGGMARREQAADSAADGTFRFDGLAPGTYRLKVRAGSNAPLVLRGLAVPAAGVLDLGDVEARPGAAVRGRVVLAAGASPVGLVVSVDDGLPSTEVTTADGRFALEGLAPGPHVVTLSPSPPTLLDQLQLDVDLAAGETRDVVFDAAAKAPCSVVVRVTDAAGAALSDLSIDVQRDVGHGSYRSGSLGTTDERGAARGVVSPTHAVRFCASSGKFSIGCTDVVMPSPGGSLEVALTTSSSPLVLEFPSTLEIPRSGGFKVMLLRNEGDGRTSRQWTRWSTPASPMRGEGQWSEHRCSLGLVAPGAYTLQVDAWSYELKEAANGTALMHEPLFPSIEAPVEVRSGETTVFEVRVP